MRKMADGRGSWEMDKKDMRWKRKMEEEDGKSERRMREEDVRWLRKVGVGRGRQEMGGE